MQVKSHWVVMVMNMSTKIISADKLTESERWRPPSSNEKTTSKDDVTEAASGKGTTLLTANQIEELQKQAYQESHERGYKEGVAAGQKQVAEIVQHLNTILGALNTPFKELDEQVEQELVSLSITIAKQLIRRELKTEPGQVIAVVREAVANLPVASRNVRVFLHPDDAAVVRENLALAEGESAWTVVEEPVMSRGGCRIVSDTSQIDATVEKRLTGIITRLLGGEREHDAEPEADPDPATKSE